MRDANSNPPIESSAITAGCPVMHTVQLNLYHDYKRGKL
jgi:hypothetical protein